MQQTYIGETGRAFGVRLQEHVQEVSQRDVRAYTRLGKNTLTLMLQKMCAVEMYHRYVSRIARDHRIAITIPGTDNFVDTAKHYIYYTRCSVKCNYSTTR